MYVRGRCVDWRLLYAYPGRPSVGDPEYGKSKAREERAAAAISPVAALACLIPGGPNGLYYRRRRDAPRRQARPSVD